MLGIVRPKVGGRLCDAGRVEGLALVGGHWKRWHHAFNLVADMQETP